MENKIEIKLDEVLRYLGYKGQDIEKSLEEDIISLIKECESLLRPKFIYREYKINNIDNEILLEGTALKLSGNDIKSLLKDCEKCVLMAVTLGSDIEKKIKMYSKFNLTKSVILDACATTAVESLCDNVEHEILTTIKKENEGLTFRYSPGYGDLSLDIQKDFIEILDGMRNLGVSVSSHSILFPRKSVTAIIGITKDKQYKINALSKCSKCNNLNTCNYRKEDEGSGCKSFN